MGKHLLTFLKANGKIKSKELLKWPLASRENVISKEPDSLFQRPPRYELGLQDYMEGQKEIMCMTRWEASGRRK